MDRIAELEAQLDAERERYELLNVERNAIDDKRHVLHGQLANTIEAAAQQEGELAEIQALAANLKSQLSQLQALVRANQQAMVDIRDAVLHGRGPLAEMEVDNDVINAVLDIIDDNTPTTLGTTTPDSNQLGDINDMVSKGGDGE